MDPESLLKYLRLYFHHSEFKNETQKDAILTILKRNTDVIVSFPSGYGRTMCYQLPSLIYFKKMTIVIISQVERIMEQVNSLRRLEIHTEVISTLTAASEKICIYDDLQSEFRKSHFLYVTTDQASTSAFHKLLSHLVQTNNLSYIVVDEAHCENQWIYGQKNNEYYALGMLRKKYKEIPWILATATAGVDVIDFLKRVLFIKDDPKTCIRFSIPCYRPNLYYDVVQDNIKGVSIPHLKLFIEKNLSEENVNPKSNSERPSGLIFCKTREVTEKLAKDLKQNGISIAAYHAGLKEADRNAVKDSFMKGHYQLLTVTSVSGMEINKANIRIVVHWGLPSSISAYYYESGQAGKDGNPARCRIYVTKRATSYYNLKNECMLADAINSVDSIEQIQNSAKSFLVFLHSRYMKDFCEGLKCRHKFFTEYFGDEKIECIDKCDICSILLHDFYGERSTIRLKMLQMSMNTYIKNICSKYHELQKNNQLTSTDAINIIKACDEFVKANIPYNPGATLTTMNDNEKMGDKITTVKSSTTSNSRNRSSNMVDQFDALLNIQTEPKYISDPAEVSSKECPATTKTDSCVDQSLNSSLLSVSVNPSHLVQEEISEISEMSQISSTSTPVTGILSPVSCPMNEILTTSNVHFFEFPRPLTIISSIPTDLRLVSCIPYSIMSPYEQPKIDYESQFNSINAHNILRRSTFIYRPYLFPIFEHLKYIMKVCYNEMFPTPTIYVMKISCGTQVTQSFKLKCVEKVSVTNQPNGN